MGLAKKTNIIGFLKSKDSAKLPAYLAVQLLGTKHL